MKITKIITFFIGILTALDMAYSNEVKSFATETEQNLYLSEIIDKIPSAPKIMNEREAHKKLKTKEELTTWAEAMGQRGWFIISGKVVDERDNLVKNVSLNIKKSRSGFWKSKQMFSDHLLSDYFVILVDGCNNLDLSFRKTGYTSPIYYLSYSLRMNNEKKKEDEARGILQKDNLVFAKDQKVLLLKQGEIVKLKKFHGILDFDPEKKNNEIFLLKSWRKTWENDNIREPYFRIKYKRDGNGEILTQVIKYNSGNRKIPEQVFLEIVSNNPEDGMLFVEDPNIPRGKILSTMGYAIDGNYIRECLLPFKLEGYQINFYYFINGKYGKGSYETSFSKINLFQNNEKDTVKKRNLWTK